MKYRELASEAAGIIREVLWCGGEAPAIKPGWSMSRELSVWRRLKSEYGPRRLNAALSVCREALELPEGHQVTMLLFNGRDKQHLVKRCIEYHAKQQKRVPGKASEAFKNWARRVV